MGNGGLITVLQKQKLNTRNSTEAKLVSIDNMSTMVLWTRLFLEEQGYNIRKNIIFQDNKSTILLENNEKKSSSQRTRAISICYFFIMDQIEKGNVEVRYCPTKDMIADYMMKPLQEKQFEKFKNDIMGITNNGLH